MIDNWNVFDETEFIGVLEYNNDNREFHLKYKGNSEKALRSYKYLCGDKDSKWLKRALFDRTFPKECLNCKDILESLGLKSYDSWEILKKQRLMNVNDLIWMSKSMNSNEFFEIHPLANIK